MKKEKKEEISEQESELEEEIKEDELKEIAEKVSDEDSTGELINDNQFSEFLTQSSESFSPVLEKLETPRQISDLEQDIAGISTTENKDEQIKSDTGYNEEDYKTEERTDENLLVKQSAPIRTENAGRDFRPQLMHIAPIDQELQELRIHSLGQTQGKLETDYVAKAEKLELDERLPFQQERKYKGKLI